MSTLAWQHLMSTSKMATPHGNASCQHLYGNTSCQYLNDSISCQHVNGNTSQSTSEWQNPLVNTLCWHLNGNTSESTPKWQHLKATPPVNIQMPTPERHHLTTTFDWQHLTVKTWLMRHYSKGTCLTHPSTARKSPAFQDRLLFTSLSTYNTWMTTPHC